MSKETRPVKEQSIVTPQGEPISAEPSTEREAERNVENSEYLPVIIKRTDETFRHPDDILEKAIEEGMQQHERRSISLLLSSIAAGMILCFTALAVGVMASLVESPGEGFSRVILASVYPLGFVLVILSRTQLFTEHTATAVYPVLDSKATVWGLLRLWGIVVLGNLMGASISGLILNSADAVVGARQGYLMLADHILHFDSGSLFISAVLAGWLMALGAWIVLASHSSVSQILSIYIVTFIIGLGGLHHSIAGTVELMAAYFSNPEMTFEKIPLALLTMLIGNMVGGSVFVAMLNYGHIRQSQKSTDHTTKNIES